MKNHQGRHLCRQHWGIVQEAPSEKTTELAIEALRLADERYAVGRATYLDNLQARLALTQARNNKVRAKYRYLSAGADLERAIAANLIEFF